MARAGPIGVQRMLDADRAEDVTQEIWLAVVRGLPRLRDPARFTPWLFAIARRSVIDRLRTEYAREHETPARDEAPVEDPIEAVVARAELVDGLASMPVMEREVLVLHYLEDLSVHDCAQICQVPVGTVKSRLNRARRLLREHLNGKGYRS
ncbi:RNA polymerase sigma factor [Dactylosporangium sp. NPDC049525]|uniref:RNA polymerase sigma factor n=1 Tax=Dactylosporangium sp. NPDC049525 TaxID=3154730 RepID=UPI003447DF74